MKYQVVLVEEDAFGKVYRETKPILVDVDDVDELLIKIRNILYKVANTARGWLCRFGRRPVVIEGLNEEVEAYMLRCERLSLDVLDDRVEAIEYRYVIPRIVVGGEM